MLCRDPRLSFTILLLSLSLAVFVQSQECTQPQVADSESTCCLPSDIDCGGICNRGQVEDICGVCGGDESTCCSCPRSKNYYASHHCNSIVPHRAMAWPAPYDATCTMPRVRGCRGEQDPYSAETLSLEPIAGDAYIELVQEYVVAKLNKASGFVACTETAGPSGENLDSLMAKASTLIGTYCATTSITKTGEDVPDYVNARTVTYLLRGYNEGYLFAGPLCNRDGVDDVANGGEGTGVTEHCEGGCTSSTQFYCDINCESGGTIAQGNCPNNWPESLGETKILCGRETYLDVLTRSGGFEEGGVVDVWPSLASAYVTAKLNRAVRKACATSEILQALSDAEKLLDETCECTDGQEDCTHTVITPSSEEGVFINKGPLSVLEKYNDGTLGPNTCGFAPTAQDSNALHLNTCCSHGCTYSVGHWVSHSCILPVPSGSEGPIPPASRIAWPGAPDNDCSTQPNQETATICGESQYGILARTFRTDSDAWTNLASQYVAAKLNIANGACTDFYGALTISSLTSFEDLLRETIVQLQDNCDSANGTSPTSGLGASMYVKQLLLESFNVGDVGSGRCSPNDDGYCNDNYATLPLTSRRCYTSGSQQDTDSCVLSPEHWKTYNYWADPPRDELWPLFHRAHTCDAETHACVSPQEQTADPVGDAIGRMLRIDPRVLGHTATQDEKLQEAASWCADNNAYGVGDRAHQTTMLSLLQHVDNSKNGTLTESQQQWVNGINQLTVALLNIRTIAKTSEDVTRIFASIKTPDGNKIEDILESLFVDNCLLQGCREYPEDAIPSFPSHHHACAAHYDGFYKALKGFNNGRIEAYAHCSFAEPPQDCETRPDGTPCGCTHDARYYVSYHSDTYFMGLNVEWPRVNTILYPDDTPIPVETEDFTSLVCDGEGGWHNILRKAYTQNDGGRVDAYLVLMEKLIVAWLNVFSGGCVPADTLEVMRHASEYLLKRIHTGLCRAGGHYPVDTYTLDGIIMISYADALGPFVSNKKHHCEDKCTSNGVVQCGDGHGTCSPIDGRCYCEDWWHGDHCETRYCSDNGIDDGTGTCHCFPGFAGVDCSSCGAPLAVSGRSYICRPCPPNICGFATGVEGIPMEQGAAEDAVVFLLTHVESASLNDYLIGTVRFPSSDGLPLPQRPGSDMLECNCKYSSESDLKSSTFGALLSSLGTTMGRRRAGVTKQQRISGNAYYDSRYKMSPGASILAEKQAEYTKKNVLRHVTNISDPVYDDVIDAIDALFFSLVGSEELTEICANDCVQCPEPPVSHQELEEQADKDHDAITGFGIAIITIVAVILFGLILLGVIVLLMWAGVSVRSNPFESRYKNSGGDFTNSGRKLRSKTVRGGYTGGKGKRNQSKNTVSGEIRPRR